LFGLKCASSSSVQRLAKNPGESSRRATSVSARRQEYARSGLSIPNTLRIRNGYNFVVQVTKDMVLRPYVDRRSAPAQPISFGPVLQ
jgi:type IV secretory pathway VirB10-like protein